ncbi:hypothetical protein SAMN05428989_2721 [Pseudoxanthomonas sp. GM95]|uniref:GNAT family N-acetyltransferase n=1 Tax=Pseudoxanthomonas sp. GM95 TaxID=1881043 RepID=UPI0008C13A80|nr:GNAT family N-acetyltransferase [Pseudoxanthomonas sp. GM95]SEL86333.1 hypothetical protein SAMN05428989_2721 [Pseudoxanthomonas sp. GM95]
MPSRVQHEPQASRFRLEVQGQSAILDYRMVEGRMHLVHTVVPEALRNQGLAAELTEAALAHARAQGLKVVPACSYAAAFLQRHPEYATLVAASGH